MITKHVIVGGKVQNVGFRNFAQKTARQLGIRGWVKNLPDRRVETIIQGEDKNVQLMLKFLSDGPTYSRVTEVQVEKIEAETFTDFSVRY